MKKCILLSSLILLLCLCMTACACEHEWKEADCEMPRMCIRCDETVGDPLGHFWVDASCAAPVTCQDCGRTRGESLPHTWTDATCTVPKTCQICGGTEGEPLGHTQGEWAVISLDVETLERVERLQCVVCEQQLDEKKSTLSVLHESGEFLLTCKEISTRLTALVNRVRGEELKCMTFTNTVTCTAHILWAGVNHTMMIFPDRLDAKIGNDWDAILQRIGDMDTVCPSIIDLFCENTTEGQLASMVIPAVLDPSLTLDSSAELIAEALSNPDGVLERNGIRYIAEKKNGKVHILIHLV